MAAELIVALDIPTAEPIDPLLRKLPAEVDYFKVGLELFIRDGRAALDLLAKRRKRVFLDLKLHDIPRTVAHAISSAGHFGVSLLTVHAIGGRAMLAEAASAARDVRERHGTALRLVAVTTLTSLNQDDFGDLGIQRTVAEQARALGDLAIRNGIDGLVTSVQEAALLRRHFGPDTILVTPGIRPAGADVGDQKRIATPAAAVSAGASCLVVGRPILDAVDPGKAAAAILEEMRSAGA